MKGFPRLTHKGILKRHRKNPQDKQLHDVIQTKEVKKDSFNQLIEKSTKQEPFGKKKRR